MWVEVLGGVGLFLLGMMLLTDGLQEAAADSLRSILTRVTRNRISATFAGASITALVQSSSATTIATIGFVSAGLLTFQQALAVIIGANLGTTSTGWLVSLMGLKVSVAAFALPLVGVGALLRMLTSGRARHVGAAIAGFGLIFVGIDVLQEGMAGLSTRFDLGALPGQSYADRLLLVLIGTAMTVVTQSSSAAVATTLAAVHAGVIGLPVAAALVIGQNVGTTVTAGVASVGATVPAKRTAAAHVTFNALTGVVAFAFLPLVPRLADATKLTGDPAIALAAFHTAFNLLGVILVIPLLAPFAALITRLVPEHLPALARNLDDSVRSIPSVAVDAARRTILGATAVTFEVATGLLQQGRQPSPSRVTEARAALGETRRFLGAVRSTADTDGTYRRQLSALHAIDHGERFADALGDTGHRRAVGRAPEVRAIAEELAAALHQAARWCEDEAATGSTDSPPREVLQHLSAEIAERRRAYRAAVLEQTARGEIAPDEANARLDAILWLDRLGYHAWRSVHHLAGEPDAVGQPITETNGAPRS